MQKLKSGSYVIVDPSVTFDPKDYRKLLKTVSDLGKAENNKIEFAKMQSDNSSFEFVYISCDPGVYFDQFGYSYVTENNLALVPIEMLYSFDCSLLEPIHFPEDFYVHKNANVFQANHLQIKLEI